MEIQLLTYTYACVVRRVNVGLVGARRLEARGSSSWRVRDFSEFLSLLSTIGREEMSDDSDVEAMLEAPFMKEGSEVWNQSPCPPCSFKVSHDHIIGHTVIRL